MSAVCATKSSTTGSTFDAIQAYIRQHRPKISMLENVPEIGQVYEYEGCTTSDAEYIVEVFEEDGFTVIVWTGSCREAGSLVERVRTFLIVLDVP